MVEVATPGASSIDYALDLVAARWQEIDEVRPRWDTLDPLTEKESYHLEWSTFAHAPLEDLRRWRDQGFLSAEQCRRLSDLEPLIARNEAFLAAVFAEE